MRPVFVRKHSGVLRGAGVCACGRGVLGEATCVAVAQAWEVCLCLVFAREHPGVLLDGAGVCACGCGVLGEGVGVCACALPFFGVEERAYAPSPVPTLPAPRPSSGPRTGLYLNKAQM